MMPELQRHPVVVPQRLERLDLRRLEIVDGLDDRELDRPVDRTTDREDDGAAEGDQRGACRSSPHLGRAPYRRYDAKSHEEDQRDHEADRSRTAACPRCRCRSRRSPPADPRRPEARRRQDSGDDERTITMPVSGNHLAAELFMTQPLCSWPVAAWGEVRCRSLPDDWLDRTPVERRSSGLSTSRPRQTPAAFMSRRSSGGRENVRLSSAVRTASASGWPCSAR